MLIRNLEYPSFSWGRNDLNWKMDDNINLIDFYMKTGIKHSPFTMSQGMHPRMIVSPVEVMAPGGCHHGNMIRLRSVAQWDTGADLCMISSELVRNLHLKSLGVASVNHVGGVDVNHEVYMVDLVLSNGVFFSDVMAIEDRNLKSTGIDFLIGLEVINEIDFAISHNDIGETVLSISFPPGRMVDFSCQ